MFAWHYLSIFTILSFIDQSIQQKSLSFIDGYRSSCKSHQQGNINLIISAPHGGSIMPIDVPDRTSGGCLRLSGANAGVCTWLHNDPCLDGKPCNATVVKDTLSDEFAENVANELDKTWGYKPFVIIGTWSRKKVDFNREINEATFNHPQARLAHQSYHSNIVQAINQIKQTFGKGLLIDIHGHGQGNYTMVGYMLTGNQLNQDDLSHSSFTTSIESLCGTNRNECIRGSSSFGTALENNGLGIAYPSLFHPKPGAINFFSGGYITRNYISNINAIQTELPYDMRAGTNRRIHAKNYAQAIINYMKLNNLLLSNRKTKLSVV